MMSDVDGNYYPYWRSNISKDIAIYEEESQNVQDRKYSRYNDGDSAEVFESYVPSETRQLPITFVDYIVASNFTISSTKEKKERTPMYYLTTFDSCGIDAPECLAPAKIGGCSYYTYE